MMKFTKILFLPLFIGLLSFIPASENTFEGTFEYVIKRKVPDKVEGTQTRTTYLDFYVKKPKTLFKINSPRKTYNTQMLINSKAEHFYILMQQQKRKVAMKQTLKAVKANSGAGKEVQFENTGKSKVIQGYQCELYKIDQSNYKGTAWVTKELDLNMRSIFGILMQSPGSEEQAGSLKASHYPKDGVIMKSTLHKKGGDETIEMEIKSISQTKIDPSQFDISSYRVMDMSGESFGR